MRVANLSGRLVLVRGATALDVAEASRGEFSSEPADVFDRWGEFRAWCATPAAAAHGRPVVDPREWGAPSPAPVQVVAFGLNYAEHAQETGQAPPEGLPPVFTKFRSSITGAEAAVVLPTATVDWEVELAVVVGFTMSAVGVAEVWNHVAGVTVAQDLSERTLQMAGPAAQFSLGKSYLGFLPMGPVLVSPDELPDPDALRLTATLNGEVVQDGNTRDLVADVPTALSRLSEIITLHPGDVVLTGTPSGVGMGRRPPRFLRPGDELVSTVEGVGSIRQVFRQFQQGAPVRG